MTVSLELVDEAAADVRTAVEAGLAQHATAAGVVDRQVRQLSVVARDEGGRVVGALLARTVWGWLNVSELWVAEAYRGKGIGRSLMLSAESAALELQDFPAGHTRHFMEKRLVRRAQLTR